MTARSFREARHARPGAGGVPAGRSGRARGGASNSPARRAGRGLALGAVPPGGPDPSGGVHDLDGPEVRDVTSLHCALSEAVAGPGGHDGWGGEALVDCLCGGFGVVPPFTLVWHDFGGARSAFAERGPGIGPTYPEEIVALLDRRGVTVRLEEARTEARGCRSPRAMDGGNHFSWARVDHP